MATLTPSQSPTPSIQQSAKRKSRVLEWEQTSYTEIPRGWSRFCRETASFLRFIGLGILVAVFQGTFRKDFSEPTKITIRRSRVSSLLKALIHVFPMAFALLEITVNLRGHYVGGTFNKLSYYQLAAKAHEIAIVASLASIVLSYVRYEVTTGIGLPFGAFLGGLQFSSVSYLWSRELWSSLFIIGCRTRRTAFFILVFICGIIAATAGPSSATLLIPRETFWSVQPSYVLINGTFQDIWPDTIDPLRVPQQCSFVDPSTTGGNILCPGSNWQSLCGQMEPAPDGAGVETSSFAALGPNVKGYEWYFGGTAGDILSGTIQSCVLNRTSAQVCGTNQPLIVATAAFNDSYLWDARKGYTSYKDIIHSVTDNLYAANTAVQCLHDTIEDAGDRGTVHFPGLLKTKEQYAQPTVAIPLDNLTKAEVYASAGNGSEYGLMWMSLPETLFDGIVSGVILTEPRSPVAGSPQNISMCTMAAGWGTSSVEQDLFQGDFYVSPTDVPASLHYLLKSNRITSGSGYSAYGPLFANVSGSAYPQRPVRMPPEWLEYLNPTSTLLDGTNQTIINAYMALFPERLSEFSLAQMVTFMLQAGLSVVGIDLAWQALPDGPIACTGCQVFEVNHQYSGWAYIPTETSIKLAIGVMVAYCILAVCHIFYLGIAGVSGDAWDSVAEVMALAMNSSPTRHLHNTCSGIYGIKPFQTTVRVVATSGEASQKGNHLELVFGEQSPSQESGVKLEIDEEYGGFPLERYED